MSGEESRTKGKLFEHQVARFLEEQGWTSMLGRRFSGKIALRPHDCDIFARKRSWGWSLVVVVCLLLVGAGLASLFPAELPVELQELLTPWGIAAGFVLWLPASSRTTKYVWIECKNLQQSIKRDLVMKLKDQFQDAIKARGTWECWLVSTSRFDEDAVAHAMAHGVRCYQAVEPDGHGMRLRRVDTV